MTGPDRVSASRVDQDGGGLGEAAWGLLHEALDVYRDSRPATEELRGRLARLTTPLRIAVTGGWRSGRSTLINALLGEEVAPVQVPDGSAILTWYEDGPEPGAVAYAAGGVTGDLAVTRSVGGIRVDLGGWRPGRIDDVVVRWPTRALRHATLLDTPPLPDGGGEDDGLTERILREADVLLCLTRDGREGDLRVLRAGQRGMVGRATVGVNAVAVLSRADELGGGRVDALLTARLLARRQARDPRVAALCLGVVPLAGLVALAGRTLSEPEYAALAVLATTPRPVLEDCLLSTDRFVGADGRVPLDGATRRALLDRLGICGVRLATSLVRTGCDTRAGLAAELVRRSGLAELREAVARYFTDRREALQARTALIGLEQVLRAEPRPAGRHLLARLEQLLAGAHDFRELRLLAGLQEGRVRWDSEWTADARPLIGANGTSLAARLGADPDTGADELWERASDALGRWQAQAEDPSQDLTQRRAAHIVVRSCEGMLAELSRRVIDPAHLP